MMSWWWRARTSSARYDQHLRYEIGDTDANAVIKWLEVNDLDPYADTKGGPRSF